MNEYIVSWKLTGISPVKAKTPEDAKEVYKKDCRITVMILPERVGDTDFDELEFIDAPRIGVLDEFTVNWVLEGNTYLQAETEADAAEMFGEVREIDIDLHTSNHKTFKEFEIENIQLESEADAAKRRSPPDVKKADPKA